MYRRFSFMRTFSPLFFSFRLCHVKSLGNHTSLSEESDRAVETPEAEVLKEIEFHAKEPHEVLGEIKKEDVNVISLRENFFVELNHLRHMYSQDGPYIGSRMKDKPKESVDERRRRNVMRIPQPEVEYRPNETSFRRLPRNTRLPNEFELRALYPQSTGLELIQGKANCVDQSAFGVDEDPSPMAYSMILPPDWSKEKEYPYMVVLPDHRGIPRDFEDVCANFFERPAHRQLMNEQGWVVICPVINLRHNFQVPVEGVVTRFCDWVVEHFRVEHGRVHLFGKGNGAYVALRTIMEHRDVAISVTAVLGRTGTPFRPLDRPQDKVRNVNGVHTLVYVPGLLRKQDWYYKFKFMMDMARIRPPLRNIHFADVRDHQVYYAINPYEFWNHMKYFRQHNVKMVTESGYQMS